MENQRVGQSRYATYEDAEASNTENILSPIIDKIVILASVIKYGRYKNIKGYEYNRRHSHIA